MSLTAEKHRKRIREMFHLTRFAPRPPRATAGDPLRTIGEDVLVTSPKVYESGMVTSLDLRLVDLYGDCAIESNDLAPATVEGDAR